MALITAETGSTIEAKRIEELMETITDLADTLKIAQSFLKDKDFEVTKETNKTLSEVRTAYLKAIELEQRIDAERKRKAGLEGGYALDLGAARSSIGCRLNRLRVRKCCKRVS
ncbi:hypothetical protein SAMN05421688_0837 [Poseidonocella pacifica]|uniref:Uncharacterized protein n=1 Tax=Poseidonocella pacifica TaxID=871651 RepID=A0A1I0VPD2_9RHOB|nr:hypothetical protein [Poseidonocella pacifica]SFA78192.1 hypothetical protein SAMN05421688_0837 [Poseidonocella pacifica]